MLAVMRQYRLEVQLHPHHRPAANEIARGSRSSSAKLFVAFLPARDRRCCLFGGMIKAPPVRIDPRRHRADQVGAFVILAVERRYKSWRAESVDEIDLPRRAADRHRAVLRAHSAGVSRAGATIIGGMLCGLSKQGGDRVLVQIRSRCRR